MISELVLSEYNRLHADGMRQCDSCAREDLDYTVHMAVGIASRMADRRVAA